MEKNNALNKDIVADNFGVLHKKVKYLEKNTKSDYKRNKKDHEDIKSDIKTLAEIVHSNIDAISKQAYAISDLREDTSKTDRHFLLAIILFGLLHITEIIVFFTVISQIIKWFNVEGKIWLVYLQKLHVL